MQGIITLTLMFNSIMNNIWPVWYKWLILMEPDKSCDFEFR